MLAANQNCVEALNNLGIIYGSNEYVPQDVPKMLHYLQLAANQNNANAQLILGVLYENGELVPQNINKMLYYFTLAANQNYVYGQYMLGYLYETGRYVPCDINKAIDYYLKAAYQNDKNAQYHLGMIYIKENNVQHNIKKGIYFLKLASINRKKTAHFVLGFIYHEGKYVDRDIDQSIHYYKEASSLNHNYSKNNLGIIYKHGFDNKIQKRIGLAIEYFKEAIKQKNDIVSMYNLAHLYLYEDPIEGFIDKSIELLIKSLKRGFSQSIYILCLALIKKVEDNLLNIQNILDDHNISNELSLKIVEIINKWILNDSFNEEYLYYQSIDFIYTSSKTIIRSTMITDSKYRYQPNNQNIKNITSLFYEGFGIVI